MASLTDDEDLVVEILARLPVKSLMRFKCVSKPWCVLISQSHFVKKHRSFADRGITKTSSRLIFFTQSPTFVELDDLESPRDGPVAPSKLGLPVITLDPEVIAIKLVGSCDGLICLELNHNVIIIWNPCTRESNLFPQPRVDCCSRFYGFGYDSTIHDHKVILAGYPLVECEHELPKFSSKPIIQVFALKSASWEVYEVECEIIKGLVGRGHASNGALHWLEFESSVFRGGSKIVAFDLHEETFEVIPLPFGRIAADFRGIWSGFHGFMTFQNRLCVYSGAYDPYPVRIHMLKEYGDKKSWTEVMKIDSNYVSGLSARLVYLRPLCFMENGEILMDKVEDGPQLALYNPVGETFRNVLDGHMHLNFDSIICSETLVSPATGIGEENDAALPST
ncbi:F-box/kelch-repeat protein At3g06240-like [Argentina anserina]|uniref:F-box/kelch-repeat protein At3g06240-like n=1 Tax=Argentina anserina TaxID=57926 RepID=UPI00217664E8|nr:F-box/kelch-repeat protein At3g06240-like [Potentilla anserina]